MLFVSSLWPYKNCDGLLRAFAAAKAELGDRQLVVVGPGRDVEYVGRAAGAGRRARHRRRRRLGRRRAARGDGATSTGRRTSSCTRPSTRRSACRSSRPWRRGCPVVTSDRSAMPETAGGAALLADPDDPESHRRRHRQGLRAGGERLLRGRVRSGPRSSPGRRPRSGPSRSTARSTPRREGATMRILVTGGAGFIGSHTCDRLVELGHDVIVLDALTGAGPPRRQAQLPDPGRRALRRRRAQPRPARQPAAPRGRRLPLRGLPGLPARLRPVHRRQRDVDRADLRDRGRREARPERVVVASSQSAMGEGLYRCPEHGEQTPDMRPEAALRRRMWEMPCPRLRRPAGDAAHPGADLEPAERLRDVEVRRGDGRHQPRPAVRHPDGGAALQHRPGPAAVGLQRLLRRLPDLQPALPARAAPRRCTRTAARSATT